MFRIVLLVLGLLLWPALPAHGQAPPAGPSEQALKAPLDLNDEKPTPGRAAASEPSGLRAFGSVILVLGLAGGGLWAFRKWGAKRLPGSGGSRLKVEETLSLGDRRFVSILRADDETFLVALSPQNITLLARLNGLAEGGFEQALDQRLNLERPMAVKDMEALIKGETP
ncbi:MAG TPA: flagellar biosynthetic protein FliO [Holophaga sp.]|nr:flagellar biosynthetic protein FliO [Holophaga sp.]